MTGSSIKQELISRYQNGNMVIRLIYINVGIFLAFKIFYLGLFLFQQTEVYSLVTANIGLSASWTKALHKPWTFFTYMFFHDGIWHILFNMLWLFWFGEIFNLYLGDRRILPLYILGGLAGAFFYMLVFNVFPAFTPQVNNTMLIGASAGILAIVFGAVAINPDHSIMLIILGPVRIKYIALVLFVIDLITITGGNAGGKLAHIGGAIFGFLFVRMLQNGTDMARPVNLVFDRIANIFKPRQNMKVAYRKIKMEQPKAANPPVRSEQEKVDEILDKISRSGYSSLSKEEKDFLFIYSSKS
jgi:membrane associated rhomboid family serine protease